MKNRCLITFSRYTDGNFAAISAAIINCMTDNPDFPNPTPSIVELTTARNNYMVALLASQTGNRSDIADKKAKRQSLTLLLQSLAAYINFTANGDKRKLLTTGFEVSKDAEPAIISKPENIQVTNGLNSGMLQVSVKAVKGAKAYLHEYATTEAMKADNWQALTTTQSWATFNNLEAGKTYYCRVAAIGSKGQLVYSDPVARMVL